MKINSNEMYQKQGLLYYIYVNALHFSKYVYSVVIRTYTEIE